MAIKPTDYVVKSPMRGTPSYWVNFQKHIEKDLDWSKHWTINPYEAAMIDYFKNIGASYKRDKNFDVILKFKSEEDFLFFKLKWI